jgi:hypothetical protein
MRLLRRRAEHDQPMTGQVNVQAGLTRAAKSRWVGHLGRVGLAAQGVTFTTIAVLALALAAGEGGEATDPQGAFRTLAEQGWTEALLILLIPGFAAYAVWRFAQALFDRGGQGDDVPGLGRRLIQFVQGLAAVGLAFSVVRVLAGSAGARHSEKRVAAGILSWPGGTELVGAIGAGFIVAGLVNAYWGWSGRFRESLRDDNVGQTTDLLLSILGKAGFAALAAVLAVVGWFLIKAAVDFDAQRVVSLGGALAKLAHATYGKYLLGAVAAGLLSFGLFEFFQVRYHRV